MGDDSPKEFDWSTVQSAEVLEESRAYRFQPEWRPLLLQFLGLAPGMHVLEVGCGPGTLAPYLAEAITPGRVTGVDLDAGFIARARKKAALAGVTNVEYVVADAYHLPFPDDTFDAVTSYTTLGVLKDPEKALGEMIRVCRPGGTVSVAEGVAGPQGICFEGVDYLGHPCYGQERRYWELSRKVRRQSLWKGGEAEVLFQHGLTPGELEELIQLCEARFRWSLEHPLYDWEASLSVVVAGQKPRRR